jgi:chromosome partitioning protein
MQEANELKGASELMDVEFPIMLQPPAEQAEASVSRAYPTWADSNASWETGF